MRFPLVTASYELAAYFEGAREEHEERFLALLEMTDSFSTDKLRAHDPRR
jgi:hypothetical protein